MPVDPKELVKNLNTAPFSRIKYLARFASEQEIAEFFQGLFVRSVEAKDSGQWEHLDAYIEDWEERLSFRLAERLKVVNSGPIPWASLQKPLAESTVALVTTGGVSVEGQPVYDLKGDWSFREIPADTPRSLLRVAHPGYDISGPREDINCVLPLDALSALVAEGVVRREADVHYGFMGYILDPAGLVTESGPEVARLLRERGVDAVVIGST